jgi:hypothetical protein
MALLVKPLKMCSHTCLERHGAKKKIVASPRPRGHRNKKDLFSPNEARGRAKPAGSGVAVGQRQSERARGHHTKPPRCGRWTRGRAGRRCEGREGLATGVARTTAGATSTRGRPPRVQGRKCVWAAGARHGDGERVVRLGAQLLGHACNTSGVNHALGTANHVHEHHRAFIITLNIKKTLV